MQHSHNAEKPMTNESEFYFGAGRDADEVEQHQASNIHRHQLQSHPQKLIESGRFLI
jgi:hypothetical protein